MDMELTSTAFQEGETIPKDYTGDGRNASPPLAWRNPPAGTRSFALICDDPDAPRGTFTHWVIYNLPAESRELKEDMPRYPTLPNGIAQGKNDFGELGYGGPAPPRGKPHHYAFKLYALDTQLGLPSGATKEELQTTMKDHVLGEDQIVATYGR